MEKNASSKAVLDVRSPNSITDVTSESWSLESLATQLARAEKKYKNASGVMYTTVHATLVNKTFIMTRFSTDDKFLLSSDGFMALNVF